MDQARLFTKCTVHRPETDLSSSLGVTGSDPQGALPVHGRVEDEDLTGSPGRLSMVTFDVRRVSQPRTGETYPKVGKHGAGRFATDLDGEPWNWTKCFRT